MLRWRIAFLVSVAIAISYLDRQTFPLAINEIKKDIPISNQVKAFLDSAFLVAYGLMYLGGGKLMDILGTRKGFAIIMIFWSLACASHGIAANIVMLAVSRLLLGIGEGGGFPAATRAVAEWFPVKERSTAMGIMNAGTAIGAVIAPPLISIVVQAFGGSSISAWRIFFFISGGFGLFWTCWWLLDYYLPERHPGLSQAEREYLAPVENVAAASQDPIPLSRMLGFTETWAIIFAKFLTDAAWYFYLFWLPKYLYDTRGFDIKAIGKFGWIPYAAAGVGCLVGGGFSSWLLRQGHSVNASRKLALGASAAMMPWVIFVPYVNTPLAVTLFSMAFFGQQSWSTLVMILPTDMFPRRAVGTVAGLVGLGGAMGGVVLGQLAGYLLDHGFSYAPVLTIAGLLHVTAFVVIVLMVRNLRQLIPEVSGVPVEKLAAVSAP